MCLPHAEQPNSETGEARLPKHISRSRVDAEAKQRQRVTLDAVRQVIMAASCANIPYAVTLSSWNGEILWKGVVCSLLSRSVATTLTTVPVPSALTETSHDPSGNSGLNPFLMMLTVLMPFCELLRPPPSVAETSIANLDMEVVLRSRLTYSSPVEGTTPKYCWAAEEPTIS